MFQPDDRWQPFRERPPAPAPRIRYKTEKHAEVALEMLLDPFGFDLIPQVRLAETGYPPQYIDYVAMFPVGSTVKAVGIEVKRGFEQVKDACDAIMQAQRYRKATVVDERLSALKGEHLECVLLWPALVWHVKASPPFHGADVDLWQARNEARYEGEARALSLFAGRWNIGEIRSIPRWNREEEAWKATAHFTVGQQYLWRSETYEGGAKFGPAAAHGANPSRGLRYVE